jgi:GAF domain-containing protein
VDALGTGAGASDKVVGRDPPDQARLGQLAEEQAALRRVATLVARRAAPDELFAAVTAEVGRLLGAHLAGMGRYDDDTVTVLATWGAEGVEHPLVPGPWPLQGDDLASIVFRTRQSVRIDDYDGLPGPIAAFVRDELGVGASVAGPIVVEGRLWGVLFLHAKQTRRPFPPDAESRLTDFTELVATAIANTESRAALAASRTRIVLAAEEQSALRRVATLVARGVPPEQVFAAVTGEAGRVLAAETAHLGRYEPDGVVTFVAAWGTAPGVQRVGSRFRLGGKNVTTLVFDTGRPARVDGYADGSGQTGDYARERGVRCSVGTPVIVEGRLWGIMLVGMESGEQPLPPDAEARLASFTDLVATAVASTDGRAALARLAEEQAALRRVATLVARAAPPEQVLTAVAEEVGGLLEVDYTVLIRSDPQEMITVVGGWTATGVALPSPPGSRFEVGGRNVSTLALRTGRPARLDAYVDVTGSIGSTGAHGWGFRSSVGVPISVEGRPWGLILVAYTRDRQLPADTEARLASFTELVATAIANTESRASVARLAEEQAALRRVAMLVAAEAPPEEAFAAVADEAGRLFLVDVANLYRYEPDGTATVVASAGGRFVIGTRLKLAGRNGPTLVYQTGRAARIESFDDASGPLGAEARQRGVRSAVATPVMVEGRLWGVLGVGTSTEQPLPPDAEARLVSFAELVATAIANAESRSELAASRRRIVAASDQARRRIERDLHDGTQQRLVSLGLAARLAETDVGAGRDDLRAELSRIAAGLADAVAELQEVSRGIHPAILSERGLGPALRTLARRSAVPVDLDVTASARFPEPVEIAAYYVASEALANAMKHARASHVEISLAARDGSLLLSIRDDGIGGADPARGSGLAGLTDRVEALGGSIQLHSAAGAGTHIAVDLPLEYAQ